MRKKQTKNKAERSISRLSGRRTKELVRFSMGEKWKSKPTQGVVDRGGWRGVQLFCHGKVLRHGRKQEFTIEPADMISVCLHKNLRPKVNAQVTTCPFKQESPLDGRCFFLSTKDQGWPSYGSRMKISGALHLQSI